MTQTSQHLKRMRRQRIKRMGFYILLLAVLVWTVFPFFYMVISSLKSNLDLFNMNKLFFFVPTMKNYVDVFTLYDFSKPLFNTTLISVVSTVMALILGLPSAYAIARYKMKSMSSIILATRVIPGIAFLIPWYIIFTKMGINGTYTSMILCHLLVNLPYIVWIMIPFFEKLPAELEESAMVDGCTQFGAFLRIMLPISKPGIVTATILAFIGSWNNFIFGLILGSSKTQPLPVAIFRFISYTEVNWGGMMAAAVVITLPIIVISLLLQKHIISGLTAGAVKG